MFNYGNAEKAIEQNRDLKDENEMLSRQGSRFSLCRFSSVSSSSFTALPTSTRWSTSSPLARGPCGMERACPLAAAAVPFSRNDFRPTALRAQQCSPQRATGAELAAGESRNWSSSGREATC